MENAPCLICGSPMYQLVKSYDCPDPYERHAGVPDVGYWRQWVRCHGCGFHYARSSRPSEILDRLYETGYRSEHVPWRSGSTEETFDRVIALPDDKSETVVRIRWIKDRIYDLAEAGLVQWSTPPYQLLDIGGASGVFAHTFQDRTWQAHVTDPSSEATFIRNVLEIPLIQQPYQPGQFETSFQLVSMIFVLEHLREPEAILKQIKRDLAPDGLLYIEVPDAIAFQHKDLDDDIFNACHLWMFDPASLIQLLNRQEYHVFSLRRSKTFRNHFTLMILAGQKRDTLNGEVKPK